MAVAPTDRGWAWMVTLGVHVLMFFVVGGFKSMGIIFVEIQETFHSTSATTAMTIGLIAGGMSLWAPFASVMGEITTNRQVILAGGCLTSIGAFLVFFAPNLLFIICAYGLFTGCGYGLMFSPCMVVLGRYFEKRRSTANGLAMAGGSLGQLVIPPILRLLVDTYSFRGAMLIFSGLCLNLLAGGALLRPRTFYTRPRHSVKTKNKSLNFKSKSVESQPAEDHVDIYDKKFELDEEEKSLCSKADSPAKKLHPARLARSLASLSGSLKDIGHRDFGGSKGSLRVRAHEISNYNLEHNTTAHYASTGSLSFLPMQEIPKSLAKVCNSDEGLDTEDDTSPHEHGACELLMVSFCCCLVKKGSTKAKSIFNWSLFGNALFLSYLLAICTGNVGYINMFTIIPPYAEDIGIEKKKVALLLSIGGVCDIVGRLLGGWFADLGIIKRNNLMAVTISIAGIFAACVPLVPTFGMLVANMVMLGFFGGFYVSLFPVVLIDYIGIERMPTGFSMTIMCMGITNIFTPTLLGKMRDNTGTWGYAMVMCGMLMLVCACCFLAAPLMHKLEHRKQQYFKGRESAERNKLENNTHPSTNI